MSLTTITGAAEVLARTEIFSGLSPESAIEIVRQGKLACFHKGESILARQSNERVLGVIISGSATVTKDKLVINRLGVGSIFGAITLFGDNGGFANDIDADGKCTVLLLDVDIVRSLMTEHPQIAESYIAYLSKRIFFLNSRIEAFTAEKSAGKLFSFLSESGGSIRVASFSELARQLDIGRASLYRAMNSLEAEGKILRNGKDICIK